MALFYFQTRLLDFLQSCRKRRDIIRERIQDWVSILVILTPFKRRHQRIRAFPHRLQNVLRTCISILFREMEMERTTKHRSSFYNSRNGADVHDALLLFRRYWSAFFMKLKGSSSSRQPALQIHSSDSPPCRVRRSALEYFCTFSCTIFHVTGQEKRFVAFYLFVEVLKWSLVAPLGEMWSLNSANFRTNKRSSYRLNLGRRTVRALVNRVTERCSIHNFGQARWWKHTKTRRGRWDWRGNNRH